MQVVRVAATDICRVEECARMMLDSEPWQTLQRSFESAIQALQDGGKELPVVLREGNVAAFVLLDLRGPLSGYIQSICVRPADRGRGLGSALMRWAEERIFRDSPNVFICVSSFNTRARRLYERLGYTVVGCLDAFIVKQHDEILLQKTSGPWAGFTRSQPSDCPEGTTAQTA